MPSPTLKALSALLIAVVVVSGCSSGASNVVDGSEPPTENPGTTSSASPETVAPTADGRQETGDPLHIGTVFPQTGQLAFLGPPIEQGFAMAIRDIEAGGDVNGQRVVVTGGDEGDGDGTVANHTVDRILADGVDAIVGAAASGISLTIIDKVTGAGVVQCSPSNTSPSFTTIDDGGLYFRTVPSDALQGPILAEQVIAAGGTDVALLARADDYGQGLLDATTEALESAGATVAVETTYDPMAQSFDAEVQQIVDSGADAAVIIAFDEGARILQTMIERGVGPQDIVVFGSEGIASNELPGLVDAEDPSVLAGMRTTAPAPASDEAFETRLSEFAPDVNDTLFAAEAYDCAVLLALAALNGGQNTAQAIADNMVAVSRDGTTCTSFADCAELISEGQDVDYDGPSGPVDFTEAGEPSSGIYSVSEFDADGELRVVDTFTSSVP